MTDVPDRIEIRACVEADALAFRELRLEALRSHPEAFSADYATDEQAAPTFWTERLRQSIDSPEQTIFFAVVDGELAGMSGIRRGYSSKTQHSAIIWGVYVRPRWRGGRLADRLIGACMAWAQHHDVRLITLAVVTTNVAAIRCYTRCGFTVYGVAPQAIVYAGRSYDELLMVRHLEPSATAA